jgi:DNA-binding beta-propeller fold protein YncE
MKIFALLVTLAVVQLDGVRLEHPGVQMEHRGFSPGDQITTRPAPNRGAAPAVTVPGTGTIYVGNYKGTISIIDEATEKLTGEIALKSGIPGRIVFSNDRSKLYVLGISYETVEIVDREKRLSLDTHTLTEGKAKVRIWGMQPDPSDKYLILVIKKYTLLDDQWEIGPPTLVQYDLATRKIARTIPWPKDEERERANVMFSPDGKLMYLFGDDILIYETEKFTQTDKWDIAQAIEPGAGRVSFGGFDPFSETPGVYTGLFTMNDPLNNRRMLGIGTVDLLKKKIDFRPIGPAKPLGWAISPDRKRAYGLFQDIGEYEFWTIDVEKGTVLQRQAFPGRPRMSNRVSSNGNIIYIYTAGNTIDYYDVNTLKKLRTMTLETDMTSFTLLPPKR